MKALAEKVGRRHALLVGHGTTAVWLTLEHIAATRGVGDVILPALLCPSVAQVVLYAGFQPRFADVRRDDFTIDLSSVGRMIGPQTRAIIPVHLFGHSADVAGLKRLAGGDVVVLEDAAQSFGARVGPVPHGALGDAAIMSFGGTKVLHAGGGGALVTDDDALADFVRERLGDLPAYVHDDLLALSHRNLYHALMDLVRTRPESRVSVAMRSVVDAYRPLYRHQFPAAAGARLEDGLRSLDGVVASRQARAEATHAALTPLPHLQLTRSWAESGVCWRYTFLADTPGRALAITKALRNGKINASNHYFSLARLFDDAELPNADFVHSRIINLWVDEVASKDYIARTAEIIGDVLERDSRS
jgi:dTDP-4-amino-4,6-dideoxygalactose transaminase